MADSNEVYVNGEVEDNSDNDDTKISDQSAIDQSVDIGCENPFVKFVRGFSNVPDESVRKMRFESFPFKLNKFWRKYLCNMRVL